MAATALQTPFTFSFMRRGKGSASSKAAAAAAGTGSEAGDILVGSPKDTANTPATNADGSTVVHPYESSIRTITTVSTVESFWETYNFLKRPSNLPATTDYHFFRSGIKPTWEDSGNAKGGKWIVRLPKGLASRYWEEIILALIGGQFPGVPDGEICGAVLSVRYAEDILGVWNRTAADREMVERIRDAIKKFLQLPPQSHMEYKPHQNSLADRSSFRNTQVWKPKSLEGRSASVGENPGASGGIGAALSGSSHEPHSGRGSGPSRRSTWNPEGGSKMKRGESGGAGGSRWSKV